MSRSAGGIRFVLPSLLLALAALLAAPAVPADEGVEDRLRNLEEQVRRQEEEIRDLRQKLGEGAGGDLRSEVDALLGKASDEGWFAEPDTLRASWANGLRLETADRAFLVEIGGRLNVDAAWFDADPALGVFRDRAGFRRARLFLGGRVHDRVRYKVEYDFAKGTAELKDAWLGLAALPLLGDLMIGNQKEPLSLEWMASGKYLTFMERALPIALVPDRQVGIGFANEALDGRLSWGFGLFGNSENGIGGTPRNVSARVAGLPWLEDGGERLLLVGASASRRDPAAGTDRLRERPEANFADRRIVDTGDFPVDSEVLLGVEGALVLGPFSLQGEWLTRRTDASAVGDPVFSGWYAFASFFLTGEHRAFKGGVPGRVSPARRFLDGEGGTGAVEVAVRFSTLDLADAAVDGGEADDWTFGLNWYLNAVTRVFVNFIVSDPRGPGSLEILMLRFEVDF